MIAPLRVYVGSVHSHRLLVEVLRGSILRHASLPVTVWSIGETWPGTLPMPQKPENRPATPFSFQRFAVPELAGYQGRALYVDSDQLVTRDLAELFRSPMLGARLLCRRSRGPDGKTARHVSSVMLLDCKRLDWSLTRIAQDMDAGRYDYRTLMSLKRIWLKGRLSRHWNALDWYEPGRTGLLHYTRRATQPWVSRNHPHAALWFTALFDGLDDGTVQAETIEYSLRNGYVRPSLAWQVEHRVADPEGVPAALHAADQAFFEHCRQNQFNNLDGDYRDRA
jgi:hypothetical protein